MIGRAGAIISALALTLAACAAAPAELPAQVGVSVFQNRFDYGVRQLEIKVSNGSDASITITRATLESTRFATPAVWDRPQLVPAGAARDLKVQLTEPVCDSTDPADQVLLEFTLEDGRAGSARVVPTDEMRRLDVISTEDCLGAAVGNHAKITGPESVEWMPGATAPARVALVVTPTAEPGSLTVASAHGTVLLSLVSAQGDRVNELNVGLDVEAGSEPSEITLLVVPSRCDAHAVAEDKRGTFFSLDVSTSEGSAGRIFVPVSDSARASLYDFYADYCGLP